MNKFIKALGAIALAVATTGLATATPITTSPTLSVAGMTFTFGANSCVITSSTTPSSPAGCSDIQVSTVNDANLGTGLAINSGFYVQNGNNTDVAITYGFHSGVGVDKIGLSFVGGILGDAIVRVDETVYSQGVAVGSASVSCASVNAGGGCSHSSGLVSLNGTYTDLTVVKDIYLGAQLQSSSSASAIYQTYAAPEPMSLALMGGGLVLVGFSRLRRKKQA